MYATEQSKVYSQRQDNNIRLDQHRAVTEKYITPMLVDLRTDNSNFPKQDLMTI